MAYTIFFKCCKFILIGWIAIFIVSVSTDTKPWNSGHNEKLIISTYQNNEIKSNRNTILFTNPGKIIPTFNNSSLQPMGEKTYKTNDNTEKKS
jgi:hypothetical protein